MGSGGTPFNLQPDGLYVIVSRAEDQAIVDRPHDGVETTCNIDDGFEWGLYWSKSRGIGQSYRYKERDGHWQFEPRRFPSASYPGQTPIESNRRIVLALHIENMHENMANLLEERLGPRRFQHSYPFRARSLSPISGASNSQDFMDNEERSRKWLGHALVVLNDLGFISLKEGTQSVASIESEALARARANMASSPATRTVEKSENVIFDGKGLDSSPNRSSRLT